LPRWAKNTKSVEDTLYFTRHSHTSPNLTLPQEKTSLKHSTREAAHCIRSETVLKVTHIFYPLKIC
jgi:hypothetical protein